MKASVLILVLSYAAGIYGQCTITTAGGYAAAKNFCAGDLIFQEEFDELDTEKWHHEISLSGGAGNWEFQIYTNNRTNSFVQDGILHIKPTLTIDQFGPDFLTSGTIDLNTGVPAECTEPSFYGCSRTGGPTNLLNPTKSAKLRSVDSFHFKYGRIEARAKMPRGDWLWAAIWMMPRFNKYGVWPASGEIDISEVRCNANLELNGVNIGVDQTGSTLHYGPYYPLNGFERAHHDINVAGGLDGDYHVYGLEWTDQFMKFTLDGAEVGTTRPPAGGFWELGGFGQQAPQADNPWRNGGHMAPFDQHFFISLNLAVGGTNSYFPDQAVNRPPKPWANNSPQAFLDFWNARNDWYPTWNNGQGDSSEMKIDYVRVYAV